MGSLTADEEATPAFARMRARVVAALRDPLTEVTILLAILATAAAITVVKTQLDTADFIDLDVYRMGGQALLDGFPLYETSYKVLGLPFTYTPFAAIAFAPLTYLTLYDAALVWLTLSVLALLRVCHLLGRELADRGTGRVSPTLIGLCLFLVALLLEPVEATLQFGQVNLIILWLIIEDLLRRRGNKAGGVLLGIATGIKLVPGLSIALLLVTRRVREGVTAMAVTALTIAAGFAFQPDQAWLYWTGIAYDSGRVGGVAYISNQSFNGLITRFTQPGGSKVIWALLAAGTAALTLWAARRLWLGGVKLLSISMIATGTLLVSPISWSHHWVWFIVIIGALLDPAAGPRAVRWLTLGLILLVTWTDAIWLVPNTEDVEYLHTPWQRLVGNSYSWTAMLVFAVGLVAAWRLPAPARRDRAARARHDDQGGADGQAGAAPNPDDRRDPGSRTESGDEDRSGADEDLSEADERGALLVE